MTQIDCPSCLGAGSAMGHDRSLCDIDESGLCKQCCGTGTINGEIKVNEPSDTEMLNWLQENMKGYGKGWICRNSSHGRGLRVHETEMFGAKLTIREAIADAMKKGIRL